MIYTRLAQVPDHSIFLLGLRGVGKSTWARSALPNTARHAAAKLNRTSSTTLPVTRQPDSTASAWL